MTIFIRLRGCTEWTESGLEEYKAKTFDAGDVKVVPGVHYVVQDPDALDSYYPGPRERVNVNTAR